MRFYAALAALVLLAGLLLGVFIKDGPGTSPTNLLNALDLERR